MNKNVDFIAIYLPSDNLRGEFIACIIRPECTLSTGHLRSAFGSASKFTRLESPS